VKLYVKKDYLDNHKELYNKLRELESDAAQHKPNSKTEEIVRSFIIPDVPIIKIFKKYHGNMYDSLKQGWDLLFKVFQCTYLVSLDSDTLVKQNWLDELHNTFKIANKKNRIV
ncbi:MAG: glycosyltransferase family A protein, partial [Candidatus Hodarchaeota archaeon]